MTGDVVYTVPRSRPQLSGEKTPLIVEFQPLLEPGESLSSPSTTLTNLTTGASTSGMLEGSPSVSGSRLTQTVTGLTAGCVFLLTSTATAVSGKIHSVLTEIPCPR